MKRHRSQWPLFDSTNLARETCSLTLLQRVVSLGVALVLGICTVTLGIAHAAGARTAADPFLWLEDVSSPRARKWVASENNKTLGVLRSDPHFARFYADALRINGAKDRIPAPDIIHGQVYNFWQDPAHVRGIWRTTTIADYAHAQPAWKTVLDLDALAKAEAKNWVWHGADCDSPSRSRCMISLSEGGEDASTLREFDLTGKNFVRGGFSLPRGKQSATWSDNDTLLVSRAWQPADVTASGYAYIVKRLRRGQPVAAAVELTRGIKSDIDVSPLEFNDARGQRFLGVSRSLSFFESEESVITPVGLRKLNVPRKSHLAGLLAGRLLLVLAEPWKAGGRTYAQGSLLSLPLASTVADPQHLKPTLIYAPGVRETLGDVSSTRDKLVVTTYKNVRGRAFVYTPVAAGGWTHRQLGFADNSTLAVAAANDTGSDAFIAVTSYLQPTTLWHVDVDTATSSVAKSLRPKFDASNDLVEQREATSKDGTRIPYFIVRPKHLTYNGQNPTVLYGYGGFEVSLTPTYSGDLGKLWLERGGVFVVANIRGGGEFGPAWHEAGLKTHRQRIYDDFAAVGKDLISRKITSPRHLGIQGGSNGGLLMGVEFTQAPQLWNAVDIQVPLLDMLRFERIAAGASWVGEYGSVSIPAERKFLAGISPYNNLHRGVKYPEPFVWTTTKDDRVGPQHARKFAARLAAMGIPYLFYEVTEGGHGAGANIKEQSLTTALEYTYFTRKLQNPRTVGYRAMPPAVPSFTFVPRSSDPARPAVPRATR